jgi:hypothetical protein
MAGAVTVAAVATAAPLRNLRRVVRSDEAFCDIYFLREMTFIAIVL